MTKKRSLLTTLVAGLAISGIAGVAVLPTLAQPPVQEPASGQPPAQEKPKDAYETARLNPRLKTFVSAIDAAGLADTLRGKGPYTILAPANSAFATLPPNVLADLQNPANKEKLAAVLKYHILVGKYTTGDLANQEDKTLLRTLNGTPVKLTKLPRAKFNDNVNVVNADIPAENGVIYVVDAVLMPPAGAEAKPEEPAKPDDPTKPAEPDPNKPDPGKPDPNNPTPANPDPANSDNPNKPNR